MAESEFKLARFLVLYPLTTHLESYPLAPPDCLFFYWKHYLRDVISASHVSRYWRSSSLSYPSLWTRVTVDEALQPCAYLLHLAVSRAGQLPLDFTYSRHSSWISDGILEAVAQYIHRFRTFKWEQDIHVLDLCRPAPALEEFTCFDYRLCVPKAFLGGSGGRLRTLCLGEAHFAPDCAALWSVRHLRVSYPWDTNTESNFWRLFDLCPRLKTVHFRHLIGAPGHELPAGPAPRTLRSAKLKAHENCDLLKIYDAWELSSIARVQLTMRLVTAIDLSPLITAAEKVLVMLEQRGLAHIFAYLPDSRRHGLSFNDLGPHPSLSLAQLLRQAAGLTHVRTLHIPITVLAPLTSEPFALPHLAHLVVYIAENDRYNTRPYLEGEEHQTFRWTSLSCLREVPQCFPGVSVPVLAVKIADQSALPSLDDAQALVAYLRAPGNRALHEIHVDGFPEDVLDAMPPPLEGDSPRLVFTIGIHKTFVAHPSAWYHKV